MEVCVKKIFISIFSFFLVFNHDFVIYITVLLPMSQLQTQQLMTSQITSHIEYLIQTYNILMLILYSELMRNVAALAVLIRFNDDS